MRIIWNWTGATLYRFARPLLKLYLRKTHRTRILILHDRTLLVVKTWLGDGRWHLPGGGLHRQEPAALGALREVREETGLQLAESQLVHRASYSASQEIPFAYELFMVTLTEVQPVKRQAFEISAIAWKLPSELSAANAQADVLTALDTLGSLPALLQ